MLGIIGGSGLTQMSDLQDVRRKVVRTPFGDPSGALTFGRINGHEVVFLARHGHGHTIPPHEVNYRANLWALHSQGVKDVLSIATVGGIHADLPPGTIAIPDQIIDYTWGRKTTYHDCSALCGSRSVVHIDFTWPYCEDMRQLCIKACQDAGEKYIGSGVYAAVQGPRLETAAEINRLERDGATMVGMTGMPEASLAREIGLCYAALTVSANYAAGRGSSKDVIPYEEVEAVLKVAMQRVYGVIEHLVALRAD
ncbi:S-methyl-5'-thioinosine phosphorylase [Sulfurimicrobium lacus]|uniref:Probable 6-oxopurine nucleoside phosphorylase n=1 Tax=Sulfurimicrobium lacus TaxID=2715678 RepID=A0A6F8VD21_9PROT|nr:S-methyl-5'-thioinosine phosphorylase [Sulfurimicrobium lacus]BCB27574.1 S-methyl-5'-thioinosine phosphorylase [Sulfurimicrobium lacus]